MRQISPRHPPDLSTVAPNPPSATRLHRATGSAGRPLTCEPRNPGGLWWRSRRRPPSDPMKPPPFPRNVVTWPGWRGRPQPPRSAIAPQKVEGDKRATTTCAIIIIAPHNNTGRGLPHCGPFTAGVRIAHPYDCMCKISHTAAGNDRAVTEWRNSVGCPDAPNLHTEKRRGRWRQLPSHALRAYLPTNAPQDHLHFPASIGGFPVGAVAPNPHRDPGRRATTPASWSRKAPTWGQPTAGGPHQKFATRVPRK